MLNRLDFQIEMSLVGFSEKTKKTGATLVWFVIFTFPFSIVTLVPESGPQVALKSAAAWEEIESEHSKIKPNHK